MSGRLLEPYEIDPPPPKPPPGPEPFVGVGLGRPLGPAALAVIKKTYARDSEDGLSHYLVGHLERFPDRTPAGDIAPVAERAVAACKWPGVRLVVDASQGDPVLAPFRRLRSDGWFRPMRVVARVSPAMSPDPDSDWGFVPGGELASAVLAFFQAGRLEVADVRGADALRKALWQFAERAGETEEMGGPTFGRSPGEELVFSVALPLWYAEGRPEPEPLPGAAPSVPRDPRRNLTPRPDSAARRRGLFGSGRDDPAGQSGPRPV